MNGSSFLWTFHLGVSYRIEKRFTTIENDYNNNSNANALGFSFHCVYAKKTIYWENGVHFAMWWTGSDDYVSKIANVVGSTLKC